MMILTFTRNFSFLLIALFLSVNLEGASGIFQTYVFYNDGAAQTNNGNIHNGSNGASNSFGGKTFTNPTTLNLTGAEIHTFKNGGSDVTGGQFYYRVYEQGSTAPSYLSFSIGFTENCNTGAGSFSASGGGQCGNGGDQKWQNNGISINLLSGITMNGAYNVDVYWEGFSSDGTHSDGSTGSPITATIVVNNILPVVLTKFISESKHHEINLSWQTTSELNNSHFEIQHSTNSKTWNTIDKVIGAGTTNEIQNYSFIDKYPRVGINYYRLKQVDYDGAFDYSPIISVNMDKKEPIIIYPNPVTDEAKFEFATEQQKGTVLSIYNINGQLVREMTLENDAFNLTLNVSDLMQGIYLLRIIHHKISITSHFLKQ